MLGIIGLLLGIVVMIVGAYKGLGAIPLTLLAALVVILFNGLPVWESFSQVYATGFSGVVKSYFFIFVASSVYASLMESTGATVAIGYKFIDWFGKKRALLVSALFVSILTYGGVSLFVVIFAAGPIMYLLFKEADLPRHLTIAAVIMGSATYTMTCMPGSPQLTNVIPAQYLGTTMTAAPILSIVATVLMFGANYAYLKYSEKKARANNEHWTFPEGYDASLYSVQDKSLLPSSGAAFAPIIVLIIIIVGCSLAKVPIASDSALLTTVAMIAAFLVCYVLNRKHIHGSATLKSIVSTGANNAISAMIGLAAVVAFGTVASSSQAFQNIVAWVLGVNMSVYFKGVFATAVIAGISGSSSGGVRLCLQNMSEYFIASGCDLSILHRLLSISAGSLDSLPHSSGLFLMLSYLGLNHKSGYKHIFIISVVTPAILAVVLTLAVTVMGF